MKFATFRIFFLIVALLKSEICNISHFSGELGDFPRLFHGSVPALLEELTLQRLSEQRARWETEVETLRQKRLGNDWCLVILGG